MTKATVKRDLYHIEKYDGGYRILQFCSNSTHYSPNFRYEWVVVDASTDINDLIHRWGDQVLNTDVWGSFYLQNVKYDV